MTFRGPLYLVDGSGFVFRAFFALQRVRLTTRSGAPTGAVYAFTQMLFKLREDLAAERLAIVFDAKSGRSFRNEIFGDYKAHRPPLPDELAPQLPYIDRIVEALHVPTLRIGGVEADDVIATLVRRARAAGVEVVIVSSDKDLMQLVGPGVSLLDTLEDRHIGPQEVAEKWGVAPVLLGDLLALMGDSVDNIPGVEGVGPKTAAKLLLEHGSLDGVLRAQDGFKPRLREAFARAGDGPRLARRLVALKDDVELGDLGPDFERLKPGDPDLSALEALFVELDFAKLLERFRPRLSLDRTRYVTVTERDALEAVVRACRAAGQLALFAAAGAGDAAHAPLAGLALAARDLRPAYVPFAHVAGGLSDEPLGELGRAASERDGTSLTQLPRELVLDTLRPLLEDASVEKIVHGHKRELALLRRAGIVLRGVTCDPMIASFLLDASRSSHDLLELCDEYLGQKILRPDDVTGRGRERVPFERAPIRAATEFAAESAESALLLAERLAPRVNADEGLRALQNDVELPLARVLADMELRGVRVDLAHLASLRQRIAAEIDAHEGEIARLVGRRVNLASPKQLAQLLFVDLGLPVLKRNKTGPSTDADVLEELAHEHPAAARILEHRMLTKLQSTYVDALPPLVDPVTHRVHTSFNQAGAATGRLSSTEPNLQNIPIRTELGREIRRAFVTDPGWLLLSLDYSQIELRVLAHLSEDERLIDAFRRGEDVHARTAREIFGLEAQQVTAEHRRIAKAVNFGVVYGQGDAGLARATGIERDRARSYIEGYFARYAGVARYMERAIAEARKRGYSETLCGRRRPLPDLSSVNGGLRSAAERMARNTPIQGTAADILKIAMVRVGERLGQTALSDGSSSAHLLLTVHDELLVECPESEAARVEEVVRVAMETALPLIVPLRVDVGRGRTWADAH